MNAPVGSLVKEAIYPLSYGDNLVDDYELVQVRFFVLNRSTEPASMVQLPQRAPPYT
jgi:hypothetical protein